MAPRSAVLVESAADPSLWRDLRWERFVAEYGTVFHRQGVIDAWHAQGFASDQRCRTASVLITKADEVVGACAFELAGGVLRFAGSPDVIDYRGPVGAPGHEQDVASAIVAHVVETLEWQQLDFAGLPRCDEMTVTFASALAAQLPDVVVGSRGASPVLHPDPRPYLERLDGRQRKEVKRKRRRLDETLGPVIVRESDTYSWRSALSLLLEWKARASDDTADFVKRRGEFLLLLFENLAPIGAARIAELVAGERVVASSIVLDHRDRRYLYNMSYDATIVGDAGAGLSPGVVLVSLLAETAVERGLTFDFLSGRQPYKLRLGGTPVDLIAITCQR